MTISIAQESETRNREPLVVHTEKGRIKGRQTNYSLSQAGLTTPLRLGDYIQIIDEPTISVSLTIADCSDMLEVVRRTRATQLDGRMITMTIADRLDDPIGHITSYQWTMQKDGSSGELIDPSTQANMHLTHEGGEIIQSHPSLLVLTKEKTTLSINNNVAEIHYIAS